MNLSETGEILNQIHGRLVAAVNVGYPSASPKPDAYKELSRM